MVGTMNVSVIVWCVVVASNLVQGEVYSSASDMKGVFQLEREMVGILGGYASKLHAKLNRINDYLQVSKFLALWGQCPRRRIYWYGCNPGPLTVHL